MIISPLNTNIHQIITPVSTKVRNYGTAKIEEGCFDSSLGSDSSYTGAFWFNFECLWRCGTIFLNATLCVI